MKRNKNDHFRKESKNTPDKNGINMTGTKHIGIYHELKYCGYVTINEKGNRGEVYVKHHEEMCPSDGHIVLVEITKRIPGLQKGSRILREESLEGRIIEILGFPNEKGVNVLAVIKKADLRTEFPDEALMQAKKYPKTVTEKAVEKEIAAGRRDLRTTITFTIDGADAKDLDDAVSLEILDNGIYRLGVHIADVSHYVKEGSSIDNEARKRGTSVYLADKVIPMLPIELSNGLCSLNPRVNRLTYSCIMDFDASGKRITYDIFPSVIRTSERMTYEDVNKIIEENNPELLKKYEVLAPILAEMKNLSELLRKRRENRGAIDFDITETKIITDENGSVINIKPRERLKANDIIEDFMLAANETVAEHFCKPDRPFIFRVHELPEEEKIKEFAKMVKNLGYKLKNKDNPSPGDLRKLLDDVKGKPEERIINTVMLRTMQKAIYQSRHDRHFGLAAEYYSHFTSPIRRYPDLTIHRLMKEYSKGITRKRLDKLTKLIPDIAKTSTDAEIKAVEAEREVLDLKKYEYMKHFIDEEYNAVISGVTEFGFFVELFNTAEGLVHVNTLEDDYYIYNAEKYELKGESTNKRYRIGDSVNVTLKNANSSTFKLDFVITSNPNVKNWVNSKNDKPGKKIKPGKTAISAKKRGGSGKRKNGRKNIKRGKSGRRTT